MLLLACANLPLFQWATPMRFGLMTSLGVLALAPAAMALGEWLLARGGRGIAAAAALAALLGLAWTSRHAYQEWWTCDSPDVERRLAGEPQTTPDIARFLRSVEARCAAGAFVRLNDFAPVLAWGPDEPDAAGVTHVMGRTATWLIARQAAGVRFAVRAPAPIPSMARFRSASGEVAVVRLDAAGWQDVELALDDTLLTRLRGRHRVDLVAETAVEVRVQGQVSAPMAGDTSPIPRSRPR
jgi:hypothetical protein